MTLTHKHIRRVRVHCVSLRGSVLPPKRGPGGTHIRHSQTLSAHPWAACRPRPPSGRGVRTGAPECGHRPDGDGTCVEWLQLPASSLHTGRRATGPLTGSEGEWGRWGGRCRAVQRSAPALPRAPALTWEPPSPRTPSPSRSPSEEPSASGACSALVPGLGVSQVRAGILQGELGGWSPCPVKSHPPTRPGQEQRDPGGRRGRGPSPPAGRGDAAGTCQEEHLSLYVHLF